ncbi:MAG: aminoacyl-tRNA hydrolase [Planctomycetaceae bacterium]|jgi:PTH1 family peptidyl-tRNA hydrolase
MKVIVGLGNPGPRYRNTRHNVGFDVLEELGRHFGEVPTRNRFNAQIGEVDVDQTRLLLVAPQTFMNNSGQAVGPLLDFYKIDPAHVLVVCDDLNLPLGRLRLREQGSAGGQKGLADILRRLGTLEVARLRIGIGQPPPRFDASNFVLAHFNSQEQLTVNEAVEHAAQGALTWALKGAATAMNQLNPKTSSDDE